MTTVCQIYLAILSTYHVFSGGLSFFFGNSAMRFYKAFYGTDPVERRHLLLILKPWGALSMAIGIAGLSAVPSPRAHFGTVLAVMVLLLLRIFYRFRCRAELLAISRIPMKHNVFNILLLIVGVVILGSWMLMEGGFW